MTSRKYDYVDWVRLGYNSNQYTQIDNLIYYTDRLVTPEGDGEVEPIQTVNQIKPTGFSGRFKHWLIQICLDGDNYHAFYDQQTEDGSASSRAIKDSGDNDTIEYFVVQLVKDDDTVETLTFESGKIAVIGKKCAWSNRVNQEFQPTVYTLVCWGERS